MELADLFDSSAVIMLFTLFMMPGWEGQMWVVGRARQIFHS
jgi:hypothetical protein